MAALNATRPNLLDVAKAMDPDGKISAVAEILSETNEVLEDAVWMEGNLPTGHRFTVRTGLPTPTWRKLYGGVQPTKGTTAQVTTNVGMLEAYAEIDKALADLNGNTNAFRLLEDSAHIEGLNQEFVDTLFYGNQGTEPEAFTGFSTIYSSTTAANADNMISGGAANGQTDCGSIWLVVWGGNTIFCTYPKASKAGLQVTDKGQVTIENIDGSNGRMEAYRTHYRWDCGLVVKDWRYAVRIHSIDKSLLTKDAASGADLPDLMFQAMRLVPNLGAGRSSFYMSRDMATMLGRQTANIIKSATLTAENVGGKFVERFNGIPVRRVDALAADENSLN